MTTIETPPAVVAATGWSFPAYREDRLENGMRVLVYDCPGQFVIAATLLFDVPLGAEPRDIEGVATLTGRCVTQGAAGRSAEEFADALALCGADLEASAFPDGFTVRLSVPVRQFATALQLMADATVSPEFYEEEFEHEKRLRLQEIEQAAAYPQHVAVEQVNATIFGDARAARPVGGTTSSVSAIRRGDVVAFAGAHLHPTSATLVVAGDFGGDDPMLAVRRGFGDWRCEGALPDAHGQAQPCATPHVVLVDFPDAPQATLRLAGPGINRSDQRWPAMFVANYAVGGSFSSRINTVLREEKGFTYGANSSLDTSRNTGLVAISTAVRSDATAEALTDIVRILGEAAGSITEDETATAVSAATQSAALGFERADAVAGRVEMLLSQGLPLDHVDVNLDRIRAVTTQAANAAYSDVVGPSGLTVVVVGDAATLEGPLREWGYADVEVVKPDRGTDLD